MSAVRGGRWSNSRDGLNARLQTEHSQHVSLNIDAHVDLLREDLAKLKQVGNAIREETTLQQQMLDNLDMALDRARAGMKQVQIKLNKVYHQSKGNLLCYVVLFAVAIFTLVYLLKRLSRRH